MSLAEALRLCRLVGRLIKANVMMTLEYRASFFIMMVNSVAQPAMGLLVWLAVSDAAGGLPLDRGQLVTYYLALGVASMVVATWSAEYLAVEIRNGDLSKALLRPAPVILGWIGNNTGEKLIKIWLMLPLVLALGWLFRDWVALPADPVRWLLFLVALLLAAALNFLMNYLVGSLAFWLQDVSGLEAMEDLLDKLLAGRFIPLALFPQAVGPLLVAQPWRYTLSFPLEVLTGQLTASGIAEGFAWQAGWLAVVWLAYRLAWRFGLRVYAAAGGR